MWRMPASSPSTSGRSRRISGFTDAVGVELGWRWTAVGPSASTCRAARPPYPSSVLMNAVPAKVAGVPRIVMVVPTPDGGRPLVLAAAHRAGVDEIYRVGGAQAVAALAYGTGRSARRQDCRSGNAFVAAPSAACSARSAST